MVSFLRQGTNGQADLLGPFVDESDGYTAEDGLSIPSSDIRLSANGGSLTSKNSGGVAHAELGYYAVTWDAVDTAAVGRLKVICKMSGARVVEKEYQVLEKAVFDAIFATSATGVPVALIARTLPSANYADAATAAAILDDTAEVGEAGGGLTALPWNSEWDAEVESKVTDALEAMQLQYLFSSAYDPASKPGNASGLLNVIVENDGGTPRFTANTLEASVPGIADAVWDEDLTGHTSSDTAGKVLGDISISAIADAVLDEALSGHSSVGTVGEALGFAAGIGTAGEGLTGIPWNATDWDTPASAAALAGVSLYDPPTNSEMEARTLPAADYATATDLAALAAVADDIKATTDKFEDMLELDSTVYRWTANALEEAPAAGALSASTIAAAVWALDISGYSTADTAGKLLNDASAGGNVSGIVAAILDEALSGHDGAGTVGEALLFAAEIGTAGAGLGAVPWNPDWDAQVLAQVSAGIEAYYLDQLLYAPYDPSAKPGDANALLNALVEDDGGVPRFTTNALEQGIRAVVEVGFTAAACLQLAAAAGAAKVSGANSETVTIRNLADTKDLVVATTDGAGNRFTITYDLG